MNTKEYQNEVATVLRDVFGKDLVKTEWDSVQHDGHTANHKSVYAPRHDIAVGPFNSYMDLDIGTDKTKSMQSHPFTKKLIKGAFQHRETLDKIWNSISRCYLAIEIEFSGSSKSILGSIVNASVSGSIGIVIANKDNLETADRICKYMMRLEGLERLEINALRNLIVFGENQFLELLLEFQKRNNIKQS